MDGAGQMNNMMLFKARFETSYRLEDVFLVMDLDMAQAGKVFFLSEVGRLEPNKS